MDDFFLIQKALRTHGIRTRGMAHDVIPLAKKLKKLAKVARNERR